MLLCYDSWFCFPSFHLSFTLGLKGYFTPSSSCFGHLAVFHETMSVNRTLGGLLERNSCQQSLCHCRMEWSFNSETMELNTGGFCCNGKQPSGHSTSTDKEKQPLEKDLSTSIFVNHGKSLALGDLVPNNCFIILVKQNKRWYLISLIPFLSSFR